MEITELQLQLNQLGREIEQISSDTVDGTQIDQLKLRFEVFKEKLENNINFPDVELSESQQEIALNKAHQEANNLVANVSHEIRTPLNGIIGFVDLLQETTLNPTQEEIVNALNSASSSLMNIINELLEYSKLAAGQEKFERHQFNLKNLISELQFLSETLIIGKDIQFDIEIEDSIPEKLIGDPSRLSQVLLNLLGNSIKFVDSGRIELAVYLNSIQNNKAILDFVVRDTGIGIAQEELVNIFNTYHQVPQNSKKFGGTGLGLSIVKQIVEKMGGSISVESILGVGTSFQFNLPFETVFEFEHEIVNTELNDSSSSDIKGKKVLVFEDNTLNQRLFKNQLENWGCEIAIVDNGLDGLKLLEKNNFDILLMDLRMPVLNGFEISRKIRENDLRNINSIPILAISADFTIADKEKSAEVGINDFLMKPYESAALKEKIAHLVVKKQTTIDDKIAIENNPAEPNLIDLEPLKQECLGQVSLLEELVSLFKKNILEFIGETRIHLQSGNFQGVDFACHKVKSCLGMVKAHHLTEITTKMTTISKEGQDIETISFLFDEFIELYPKTEDKLDLEFNKLKLKA
ncbi:ATP-binding protein [Croceivirga thetidis]|uniref:histidine kinase n=1 Tax=Croceivirga thetidis TaxID=2721623 RepID=A0ABX1GQR9_9FLAO|nr:ATP-binding protein [Croceivirga thetidis]NKI32278.1 response regulator [Croceivirga thetidis]